MHHYGLIAIVVAVAGLAYTGVLPIGSSDEQQTHAHKASHQEKEWDQSVRDSIDSAAVLIKKVIHPNSVGDKKVHAARPSADPSQSWAWGADPSNTKGLYEAWKAWALTQGTGIEPVKAFINFVQGLDEKKRVSLLSEASTDGNWPIMYNMLAAGLVIPDEGTAQGREIVQAIGKCESQAQCAYLAAIQAISPTVASSIYKGMRQDKEALPDVLDIDSLKSMATTWAQNAYEGKAGYQ